MPQLVPDLGTHHFGLQNCERPQAHVGLQSLNHFGRHALHAGKLVGGAQDTAMIRPIGADRGTEILQILLGERNPGLLQRPAHPVGQFGGRGVVQVDLSAGVAVHPAQDLLNQLAVGVQLLFILDLGAD